MIISIIMLNIFDVIVTYNIVIVKGVEEANPIVKYILQISGITGLIVFKTVFLIMLYKFNNRKALTIVLIAYIILTSIHFRGVII